MRDQETLLRQVLCTGTDYQQAQNLLAALDGRQSVIAFVGAGASIAAGYPTWDVLLDRLHRDVDRAISEAGKGRKPDLQKLDKALLKHQDPLWRAEEYRLRTPPSVAFQDLLRKAVVGSTTRRPKPLPVMGQLIDLPFSHFITTNYDDCIERAASDRRTHDKSRLRVICWSGEEHSRPAIIASLAGGLQRKVVHLHGVEKDPSSLILTNRDYARFYLSTDRQSKQLFALFATHRFFFVGCSMEDPHVLRVLEQVQALGQEGPRHWALLADYGEGRDARAVRRRMLEHRYGVAPFYDRAPRHGAKRRVDHSGFSEVVGALSAIIAGRRDMPPEARAPEVLTRPMSSFPAPLRRVLDPDDPCRGRFGRQARRDGLELSAAIEADPADPDWFTIRAKVAVDATFPRFKPLRAGTRVTFHLHPTFPKQKMTIHARRGAAQLERYAWGAFTLGAVVHGRTCLELDLSRVASAPASFRKR